MVFSRKNKEGEEKAEAKTGPSFKGETRRRSGGSTEPKRTSGIYIKLDRERSERQRIGSREWGGGGGPQIECPGSEGGEEGRWKQKKN